MGFLGIEEGERGGRKRTRDQCQTLKRRPAGAGESGEGGQTLVQYPFPKQGDLTLGKATMTARGCLRHP